MDEKNSDRKHAKKREDEMTIYCLNVPPKWVSWIREALRRDHPTWEHENFAPTLEIASLPGVSSSVLVPLSSVACQQLTAVTDWLHSLASSAPLSTSIPLSLSLSSSEMQLSIVPVAATSLRTKRHSVKAKRLPKWCRALTQYLCEWTPQDWVSFRNELHLAHCLHWRRLGSNAHGGYVVLFDYADHVELPDAVYALLALSSATNSDAEGFPSINVTELPSQYQLPARKIFALLRALVKYFQSSDGSQSMLRLRALVHERHGGIDTEFRTPAPSHYHLLWVNPLLRSLSPPLTPTTVVHIENGILFHFDVMSVMYSAGNGAERMRVRQLEVRHDPEIVVDMFAGIGYFVVPFALRSPRVHLVAIEKVQLNRPSSLLLFLPLRYFCRERLSSLVTIEPSSIFSIVSERGIEWSPRASDSFSWGQSRSGS